MMRSMRLRERIVKPLLQTSQASSVISCGFSMPIQARLDIRKQAEVRSEREKSRERRKKKKALKYIR